MATPLQRRLAEDRALKLEQRAEQYVPAELRKELQRVNRRATKLYVRLAGGTDKPLGLVSQNVVKRVLLALLAAVGADLRSRLLRTAKAALHLGVDIGTVQYGSKVVVNPRVDRKTMREINAVESRAREELTAARKLLRQTHVQTFDDVMLVLARAARATSRAEATTRWVTNRAINTGSAVVSRAIGAREMWVPERGACLTCLAYAGEINNERGMFPAGLTFGETSTVEVEIDGPPAHPNCRCRKVPWLGSKPGVGPVEAPDALKREAEREVLRGTAQASELQKLKAADKLLSHGTALPKSVQKKAQAAVRRGKFAV
jgi:hypothetical protein